MPRSSLPPFPALPEGPVPGEPHPDAVRFILRLGKALHECGYASHRLEQILTRAADRIGLPAQFFTTPTSIFASFGSLERQRTYLMRVEPAGQDLGRMADIDTVIGEVVRRGTVPLAEGAARIDAIMAAPSRYGAPVLVLAFGLASGASARFLGGGWRETLVGAATGLATISLLGSQYDTMLAVYKGPECNPTWNRLLGCNDDFGGLQSLLSLDVVGGDATDAIAETIRGIGNEMVKDAAALKWIYEGGAT